MITVYEGVLGGGKSYHAVIHAARYLAQGGLLYTNISLVREECEKFCRDRYGVEIEWERQVHELDQEKIKYLHKHVKGGTSEAPTLAIVDELHLYHNARDWAQSDRDLLSWLTQSRKLFVDIIFIVQHRNNVDKQWMRLTAGFYRGRDLRKWTIPVLGAKWPGWMPWQFLWCQFDQDGKTLVRRDFEPIDSRIFKLYSSEQLFDGTGNNAGRGAERLKLNRARKTRGQKMRKLGLILLVLIAVASLAFGKKAYAKLNPGAAKKTPEVQNVSRRVEVPQEYRQVPQKFVECFPEVIEWHRTEGGDVFHRAFVNGHWTQREPAMNKRGEMVYVVEVADLTEEEKEKLLNMGRKLGSTNMPVVPYQQTTNGVPRRPATNRPFA